MLVSLVCLLKETSPKANEMMTLLCRGYTSKCQTSCKSSTSDDTSKRHSQGSDSGRVNTTFMWYRLIYIQIFTCMYVYTPPNISMCVYTAMTMYYLCPYTAEYVYVCERWGAGVETQKNVRGEVGGWGRVLFNEPYAPSLSTIYDGA